MYSFHQTDFCFQVEEPKDIKSKIRKKNIIFMWVPGHFEFAEIETDCVAKEVVTLKPLSEHTNSFSKYISL